MDSAPSAYVPEKKHTVFVSGIPDEVDEDKVLAVFVSFGQSAAHALAFLYTLMIHTGRQRQLNVLRICGMGRMNRGHH